MTRRFVLITGSSRGLGRSLALALAQRGFSVLAGVRRRQDGDELRAVAGGELTPVILDVASAESFAMARAEVERLTTRHGLDGLINNAGVAWFGPLEQTPIEVIDRVFRVNVSGVIAAIQCFLPLVRQAKGRIVNISSINGRLSFPFASIYNASKFALEALSDSLRVELAPWGIRVAVVEPGATRTDIRDLAVRAWAESRASLPPDQCALYAMPFAKMSQLIAQLDSTAADHAAVVEAVYDGLTSDVPRARYLAGEDTVQLMQLAALPDAERDAAFLGMFS
jgi:NAD(P)-dependent dehydrogenase (short-subunit alcohol dehydrogenase family)